MITMRRSLALGSLLAIALVSSAAAASRVVDRVVAVVNDELVLESEVDQSAIMTLKASGRDIDFDSATGKRQWDEQKHKALDELIDERLVLQQAVELKLSVTSAQVDLAIDDVKHQNNLNDGQFKDALRQQGFTVEAYRKQIRRQILELQVKNITVGSRVNVSDAEIQQLYTQVTSKQQAETRYHALTILVKVDPKANDEETERKLKVAQTVFKLAQDGTKWSELVRNYSDDDVTKAEGGDMGTLPKDEFVDAIGEQITSMKPGEFRGPIRTGRGWQIVELVEIKVQPVASLDSMRETLRRKLYTDQLEKITLSWLKELRRKAHLDIRF